MSNLHNMTRDIYPETTHLIICGVCGEDHEYENMNDELEVAKQAHKDGWRYVNNDEICGTQVVGATVCPTCYELNED